MSYDIEELDENPKDEDICANCGHYRAMHDSFSCFSYDFKTCDCTNFKREAGIS